MKKIALGVLALALILGVSSCDGGGETTTTGETHTVEYSITDSNGQALSTYYYDPSTLSVTDLIQFTGSHSQSYSFEFKDGYTAYTMQLSVGPGEGTASTDGSGISCDIKIDGSVVASGTGLTLIEYTYEQGQ